MLPNTTAGSSPNVPPASTWCHGFFVECEIIPSVDLIHLHTCARTHTRSHTQSKDLPTKHSRWQVRVMGNATYILLITSITLLNQLLALYDDRDRCMLGPAKHDGDRGMLGRQSIPFTPLLSATPLFTPPATRRGTCTLPPSLPSHLDNKERHIFRHHLNRHRRANFDALWIAQCKV
jgi:hypothetical protein